MHFSRLQKCVLNNLSEKNSLQSCVQVGGVGEVGGRANNVMRMRKVLAGPHRTHLGQ